MDKGINKKGLTVAVNITETVTFKELLSIVSKVIKDNRISENVRDEYLEEVKKITDKVE